MKAENSPLCAANGKDGGTLKTLSQDFTIA